MTVYDTTVTGVHRPAAELAEMCWITGQEPDLPRAAAVHDHVLSLLRSRKLLD
ncbi:hypothetical protein [Streptomyces sp. NPDC058307]|uniref:hypothetical protein n=1 Tax=Streptomyces sp. NPDC058307 TaxID=3346439 RepID=UPI0036EF0C05